MINWLKTLWRDLCEIKEIAACIRPHTTTSEAEFLHQLSLLGYNTPECLNALTYIAQTGINPNDIPTICHNHAKGTQ